MGAWCRLRRDFRNFRPDRIAAMADAGEIFADDRGRGIDAYLRSVGVPGLGE